VFHRGALISYIYLCSTHVVVTPGVRGGLVAWLVQTFRTVTTNEGQFNNSLHLIFYFLNTH
jgi:uncharacterized membrane protein